MLTLSLSVGSVMLLSSVVLVVGRFSCVVRALAFRRTSALIGAVPNRDEAFGTVQSVMPVNASSRLVMRRHFALFQGKPDKGLSESVWICVR